MSSVIRLPPFHYIHVLDNNLNTTNIVTGPYTFVKRDHQQIKKYVTKMTTIPPRHYCIVKTPFIRDVNGKPVIANGQVKLRHGQNEVRLSSEWQAPFPLYPGEQLSVAPRPLEIIRPNCAFKLRAVYDFDDGKVPRKAGDEWMQEGPGTFIPHIEYEKVCEIRSEIIEPNTALRLRAKERFTDRNGNERKAGEEWLVKEIGSYLPDVREVVKAKVVAQVLTDTKALRLLAMHSFTDIYNIPRKAGQEWLVTKDMSPTCLHLPDVHEKVIKIVNVTTLTKLQYCVVLNPVTDGVPRWKAKQLRVGEASFFLEPGEELDKGLQLVEILGEEDAILVRAVEKFTDEGKERSPGQIWMIHGPRKYVPPVEIKILERRTTIPLDKNEGIYIRNKETGKVSTKYGQSYMLKPAEEKWEKELSPLAESLLQNSTTYLGLGKSRQRSSVARCKWKAVTYRVPHNAAVQVYDYKTNHSRVIFGPELVMLEPNEEFTITSLSGGEPKKPGQIINFALHLGPDFMRDSVTVETSDHAQLRLKLCYNWKFDISKESREEDKQRIFSVRDYVGDTCKNIASRVRGAVANVPFEKFHKNSSDIIRQAVFMSEGELGTSLFFTQNQLKITNVDIQSVEPIERSTRDALQKSVQQAIEIATSSQEALANHKGAKEEQVNQGSLEKKKIGGQVRAETERKDLVVLKAKTAAQNAEGKARSEAEAEAKSKLIQAECAVTQAEKKAEALRIRSEARLSQQKSKQAQELEFIKKNNTLEIKRAQGEAKIQSEKFEKMIKAIGCDTIKSIAQAGPEMQTKLLEGLGLEGFLVTDGTSPINLFNTASGMVQS